MLVWFVLFCFVLFCLVKRQKVCFKKKWKTRERRKGRKIEAKNSAFNDKKIVSNFIKQKFGSQKFTLSKL